MYSHRMLTIANHLEAMHRLGRAMADPTRSRILLALLSGPSYPAVLSRELGLSRSNVSNHLTCLRGCGIVVAEPEGRKTRYEIADPHLTHALIALLDVTLAVDESVPCVDSRCEVEGCGAKRRTAEYPEAEGCEAEDPTVENREAENRTAEGDRI